MPDSSLRLISAFRDWFRGQLVQHGLISAAWRTCSLLWEFLLDSLPSRRRQRYGDADYDWDHRVDTTAATVTWRDRLLGLLNSPYQPTDPALFHEMLSSLKIDFSQFTFIDIGSGKGRVLLLAAEYPFRCVIGVELMPALHRVAQGNIAKYKSDSQQCFAIELICGDASEFVFPPEPLLVYLFNPLPEAGLVKLIDHLERSFERHPRALVILYHNPLLEHVLARREWLQKAGGTHQYSVFTANPPTRTSHL
jgi:SAM-dependent methyltransferase